MTDLNGKDINCPVFTIADDVKVYHSCAVTYQNQFFVYGGQKGTVIKGGESKPNKLSWLGSTQQEQKLKSFSRQIAKVANKSLKRVGDLTFDFTRGGCTSTTDKILLCFSEQGDWRTCYKSKNPMAQFRELTKSKDFHLRIKFASSECKFFRIYGF